MEFQNPIQELIERRISCRTFRKEMLSENQIKSIQDAIDSLPASPNQSPMRFKLVVATPEDPDQLKALGTYGFIQNPVAFIIGACEDEKYALVDFGYLMELLVLKVEDLGLGSIWLGGSFKKSRFSGQIGVKDNEVVPCVIGLGVAAEKPNMLDRFIRFSAKSRKRKSREALFFNGEFDKPLSIESVPEYRDALEAVRIAPSASNQQPWRIVKENSENTFHFYLQRIGNYHKSFDVLKYPDLQKTDIGICMSHFDKMVQSAGLSGQWKILKPEFQWPENAEYMISWIER